MGLATRLQLLLRSCLPRWLTVLPLTRLVVSQPETIETFNKGCWSHHPHCFHRVQETRASSSSCDTGRALLSHLSGFLANRRTNECYRVNTRPGCWLVWLANLYVISPHCRLCHFTSTDMEPRRRFPTWEYFLKEQPELTLTLILTCRSKGGAALRFRHLQFIDNSNG